MTRRGRGERSDAHGHNHEIVCRLVGCFGEQRRIAVDDPVRGTAVADVGDELGTGFGSGRVCSSHCVLVATVDHDDLCALGGDRFPPRRQRACGQEDPAAQAPHGGHARDGATVVPRAGRHERVCVGRLAQRSLDRPGGTEDLERRQTEAVGLILH